MVLDTFVFHARVVAIKTNESVKARIHGAIYWAQWLKLHRVSTSEIVVRNIAAV